MHRVADDRLGAVGREHRGLGDARHLDLVGRTIWRSRRHSEGAAVLVHSCGSSDRTAEAARPSRRALVGRSPALARSPLIGICVTLMVGAATHRGLRSWFAITLLVAAWLTVCVAWPEIAWQGRRFGAWCQLNEFEAIAASLRDNWPTNDGERAGLGSFMAYPKGRPRTLMLLKSKSSVPISAVERNDDGTLSFELRSAEPGTWLEWHPAELHTPRLHRRPRQPVSSQSLVAARPRLVSRPLSLAHWPRDIGVTQCNRPFDSTSCNRR